MCKYFSFGVSKDGRILAIIDKKEREELEKQGKNPDSHSFLAQYFKVFEDMMWKFDLDLDAEKLERFKSDMTIGELREFIEKHYDGGLPLNELPLNYLVKITEFIAENKQKIIESAPCNVIGEFVWKKVLELMPTQDTPRVHRLIDLSRYPTPINTLIKELEKFAKRHPKNWKTRDGKILYITYPQDMNTVYYVAVSSYIHYYVDENNQLNSDVRYNIQFHSLPFKI